MFKQYIAIIIMFSLLLMTIPSVVIINDIKPHEDISSHSETPSDSTPSETPNHSSITDNPLISDNEFKVLDITTGQVLTVSERDYIIGAVCAEMPATFHEEALKAQAVAAHTYAVRQREKEIANPTKELMGAYFSNDSSIYQAYFTVNQAKQFYKDSFDVYYNKICEIVDEVENEILTYNDEPIVAAFHSMSSGKTESALNIWGYQIDYLVPVESDGDVNAPKYLEEYTFTAEEMKARLVNSAHNITLGDDPAKWLQIKEKTPSDTIISLQVGDTELTGLELRTLLSIRSAAFEIAYENDEFTITTKGFGHGVGMSQYGANSMANSGSTYREILSHYYSGTEITEI